MSKAARKTKRYRAVVVDNTQPAYRLFKDFYIQRWSVKYGLRQSD